MKQTKTAILFTLLFIFSIQLIAQITCNDPLIIIADNMEAYELSNVTDQAGHWIASPGTTPDVSVSTEQAESGTNSLKFDGFQDAGTQDILLLLSGTSDGHYLLRYDLFVPAGNSGFLELQHEDPSSPNAGFNVTFSSDGTATLASESTSVPFTYPQDTWIEIYIWLDLDNDQARLNVNERTIASWVLSESAASPSTNIHSVNFTVAEDQFFFIDNVDFWQIPAPETGQYCYTSTSIEPGIHPVPLLECFGGSYDIGGNGSGKKGYWFNFTPTEDGIISIASCLQGVDTRGWIFRGDCNGLDVVGVNDDQCEISEDGSEWASYREAVVEAGNTYYIMWDDAWEDFAFDFELTFSNEAPSAGNFCQSAIAVDQGEHTVDEMDGNAAVAGPNINNTSSSTTNYSKSEWFSYTPPSDGNLIISSCDGAGSDTHVFVYTGDCATFSGLNLVAQNRDSEECSAAQSQVLLAVTEGTTYYIEWIDRWAEDAFFWNLLFDPTVAVNDKSLDVGLELFPNPASDQLFVQIDWLKPIEQVQLKLVNLLGATLLQQDLGQVQKRSVSVDVSTLPSGAYLLQLSNGIVQVNRKIIIQ